MICLRVESKDETTVLGQDVGVLPAEYNIVAHKDANQPDEEAHRQEPFVRDKVDGESTARFLLQECQNKEGTH